MKKYIMDFSVVEAESLCRGRYALLKLTPAGGYAMPEIEPGQFVQVKVEGSQSTFLRRPISVNNVEADKGLLWLLIRKAGEGTARLTSLQPGDVVNLLLPLGNHFKDYPGESRLLLAGGGVGVAPLLYWGKKLRDMGLNPEFLLGARTEDDLLMLDEFYAIGPVHISTDDGSLGHPGIVTLNPALQQKWDRIYCCGPAPMMKGIAAKSAEIGAQCEVSLENMMACGLGACLCCVEQTVRGNVCVCTEGPVFNIKELTWLESK